MGKAIDLTNQRFGQLTAMYSVRREAPHGKVKKWVCNCDCGKVVEVGAGSLRSGNTKSCGQCVIETKNGGIRHGRRYHPLYMTYKKMIGRCYHKHNSAYKYYGAKGVRVYDRWLKDINSFINYVEKLPHAGEDGYTLDRLDGEGDYEPGNVRWATPLQQAANRSNTHYLTVGKTTMGLTDWSRQPGAVSTRTIHSRLNRGWSHQEAIFTPVWGKRKSE